MALHQARKTLIRFLFQKEQWLINVNQFVEDEDEESFSCSVRISAQYLLMVRISAWYLLIAILSLV